MKVQVIKEKDYYFAKIKWVEWAYAQWETFQESVENLMSVYQEVLQTKIDWMKKMGIIKKIFLNKIEINK